MDRRRVGGRTSEALASPVSGHSSATAPTRLARRNYDPWWGRRLDQHYSRESVRPPWLAAKLRCGLIAPASHIIRNINLLQGGFLDPLGLAKRGPAGWEGDISQLPWPTDVVRGIGAGPAFPCHGDTGHGPGPAGAAAGSTRRASQWTGSVVAPLGPQNDVGVVKSALRIRLADPSGLPRSKAQRGRQHLRLVPRSLKDDDSGEHPVS